MSKPKLLIADSGLGEPWLMPMFDQWFDSETYRSDRVYNPNILVVVDNRYDGLDLYNQIQAHGHRIVLPYLIDSNVNNPSKIINNELVLHAPDWVWIQESLHWRYLNYHQPRAPATPSRFFLLLMNIVRAHRDQLKKCVAPYLDQSLHSYVERGVFLDGDEFVVGRLNAGTANDRFYCAEWYAQTCFSLVAETKVQHELFISEKIFKPLAYNHAMIVLGTPGTLQYIRNLGFETFAHCIDESYDQVPDYSARLQKILDLLADLYREFSTTGQVFQDTKTQAILAHNHARFFDQAEICTRFQTQIANPIMEFLES